MNKAIEINPDTSCFHSNLGLQYRHKLNHEEALSCFQKALEIKREAPTLAMIGGCYGELKNLDEAEKYILQAIEMKPDFAAAHVDLASVLKLKGKWHEGFIEYEWRYDVYDVKNPSANEKLLFANTLGHPFYFNLSLNFVSP